RDGWFRQTWHRRAGHSRAAPRARRSGAGEGPDHAAPPLHRESVCGSRAALLVRCVAALLEGDASRLQARAHGTAAGRGRRTGSGIRGARQRPRVELRTLTAEIAERAEYFPQKFSVNSADSAVNSERSAWGRSPVSSKFSARSIPLVRWRSECTIGTRSTFLTGNRS